MSSKVRVWDLSVRLFHWSLAGLVGVAALTGEEDDWATLHARVGAVILGLIVYRLVWGLVGSPSARFADFVRGPRAILAYARDYARGRPPHVLGHNPLGGAMVLALLGALLGTILTGSLLRLGPEWGGPLVMSRGTLELLEEAHETAAGGVGVLVVLHVAGVLLSSLLEQQNLVAGMFTGMKRGEAVGGARARPFALLLALIAGLSTAVVAGRALAEPSTTPSALIAEYGGGDAARGQQLYRTEVSGKSCASCHGEDPRGRGRTPAGKWIEPLAPSANERAFTDRARADKWFDRNCKQVLGRVCTGPEKASFIAFVSKL